MSQLLPIQRESPHLATLDRTKLPVLISEESEAFLNDFLDFFIVTVRNHHTRRAYGRAIRNFCVWCQAAGISRLAEVNARVVSIYIESNPRSVATIHQELAGLTQFFAWMVAKGHFPENPCQGVKRPRISYTEGKTPALETEEARELLDAIDTSHVVGLRDRAFIGVMLYTFARVGAVTKLQVRDYAQLGKKKYCLKLTEKGSKHRKIPVHHTLEEYLDAYLDAGRLHEDPDSPLFRSTRGQSRTLTDRALSSRSALAMVKRRSREIGLPDSICNHSFRATGITNFLTNGGSRDRAQFVAGHADVRTTELYDRRREMVTLSDIERIRF